MREDLSQLIGNIQHRKTLEISGVCSWIFFRSNIIWIFTPSCPFRVTECSGGGAAALKVIYFMPFNGLRRNYFFFSTGS